MNFALRGGAWRQYRHQGLKFRGCQQRLGHLEKRNAYYLVKEERYTMYMVTIDKNKCDGDGTCINMCPQSVFKLEGGKADPVNISECINCLTCVENCPQQAITVNEI
jgi:NAD-dependent dihydropyrimidine dehydrogenase PreA subunit